MNTNTDPVRALAALAERAIPFLRDEAAKYDDDGSNEPLELARDIESLMASLPSDESALPSANSAFDGGREAALGPAREPDGYTSYGEFRWACDCDDRMKREWTPVYLAPPSAPVGEEAVAYRWRDRGTMQMIYSDTHPGYCNVEPLYAAPPQAAAASVEAVGDWVLVPRQPTLAMANAAWRELESQGIAPEDVETPQVWGAMLAAAPQQPAGVDGDEVRRVAQHIGTAADYIDKAYPDANMLDRGPILRNMRRWHERLTAALAGQQPAGVGEGLTDEAIERALDAPLGLDHTLRQLIRGDTVPVGFSKVDVVRELLRALAAQQQGGRADG